MSSERVDPIDELVRQERLVEAAALVAQRGDLARAADLYERACDWAHAAVCAERAGDFPRALRLYVEAKDDVRAHAVLPKVAQSPTDADRVAYALERRGASAWAAQVLEAAGRLPEAARAWERAQEAVRAARLLERAKDVVGASRVLEAQLRREPTRWEIHLALGDLLMRYGKTESAVRNLQKIPAGAAERRRALSLLARGFDRLGLLQAKEEALRELEPLGGPEDDDGPAAIAEVKARLFGRYEVVREVAQSPTARVVECVDGVRGERVAVKVFAAYDVRGAGRDALARFEREVKVLASLDHPNILPLRDYVPEGPALVLAWMEGGTLETMLAKEPIAPARAVEIACAVLGALGEAHRMGVLHRDVKPANVLFDGAGVTRLGDFGVAHLGDLSATATAGIIGTLGYMSPEQREGRPATVQSDLYGVGAVLREMLTGERPQAGEAAQIMPSAVHRDLDQRHDAVVAAMVDPDPAKRPADAFAARRALQALPWPHTIERAAQRRDVVRKPSERPSAGARTVTVGGVTTDRWLDRAVVRVPLDASTLARAGAFARAGHRALQLVLRVDRAAEEIWLAAPRGVTLAARLGEPQRRELEAALAALHDAGAVHGSIDRAHVVTDASGAPCLLFTTQPGPLATIDTDRLALAELAR